MENKITVTIGVFNNKIAMVDREHCERAIREALREGYDYVVVTTYTDELRSAWLDQTEVDRNQFKDISFFKEMKVKK